jgi:hypothetical protein
MKIPYFLIKKKGLPLLPLTLRCRRRRREEKFP